MNRSKALLPTAIFCLLISGAAGLVYQVAWMRYLSLFLGHTSYAVVAVLVAFMGGLALGNAWLGERADRLQRPLAFYALLEIGIAVYAVIFPYYFKWCDEVYVGLARSWQPAAAGLLGLKFVFSLLTILLPTVLMGGTLPVMTKLVTRSLGELRERVSTLYFINSLGAVVGCFLADFWWIPSLGLEYTVLAGAVLNFVVGAIALFVSGWIKEGQAGANRSQDSQHHSSEGEERFTPHEITLAVVGIGVSGFVAMLYEVVWTRMLALALGSSTHAFSLMLITFITGIAVGAWIVGRWKRLMRTLDAFGWAEFALAATLLVSMCFYERVPYWFMKLAGVLARRAEVYPLYEFFQSLICFGVMFVPTVCLGMTLPLVSRIATAELARTGRSVGKVFSVNTLGTVLGAAVTGLWLLPWLGLARTLALGIALNAGIAAIVLGRHKLESRRLFAVFVPIGSVAFVIVAGVIFDHTWRRAFTMGLWRGDRSLSLNAYREGISARKHAYYCDGAGATVSVERDQAGGKETLALLVNGKPEASTTMDVVTQLLLGHIPMLLRLDAKQALVVGLGSGMTGGAVIGHPGVERLDVVEISPEVVQAARVFSAHNAGVLDDRRVRVVLDDAKSFLRTTDRKYDVIISEPSNPWMAGVAGVFSLEYYGHCSSHLSPGGVMAQWVQMYESNDDTLKIVLKTFSRVFSFVSVWEISRSDLMLLGSNEPFPVDFQAMQQRMSQAAVKADLGRIDLFSLPVLLALETISPEDAAFIAPPSVAVHSDYYPVLEYAAQRALFVRGATRIPDLYEGNRSPRPGTLLGRFLKSYQVTENDFKAFALFQTTHHIFDPALFRSLLTGWQNKFPQSMLAVELSAKASDHGTPDELEAARLAMKRDEIFQEAARDPELLRLYARFLIQSYWAQRSAFYLPPATELESVLHRLIETDPPNQRIYKLRLAGLAWDRQDDDACLRLAQSGFDPDVKSSGPINLNLDPRAAPRTVMRMIDIYLRRGDAGKAWNLCQQARTLGFIGAPGPSNDPILEMTYRKVEAIITRTAAEANPGRAVPQPGQR
jgi:predicted membrane-bound spermidine synthase